MATDDLREGGLHWFVYGDQSSIAKPYRQHVFATWTEVKKWRDSFSHFPAGLTAMRHGMNQLVRSGTVRKIKGCGCYPLRPRKTNDK